MISRTAGAPSLPIKSEADLLWEQAVQQHAAGEITDSHLLAVAKATGRSAQVRADIQRQMDNASAGAAPAQPSPPSQPGLTLPEVDTLAGDEPGTRRVWNPQTMRYDTVRSPAAATPEPDTRLGSRWGGGRPFSSQSESQEYRTRPTLSPDERQAMVDAGATDEEIADAQASQADRDARQAGLGSPGGYAPVFINGRVHMLPRAPTPGPEDYPNARGAGVEPGSTDASAVYDFAQAAMAAGVGEQLPIPLGDDGRPVAPGFMPGTANAATNNSTTGPRAANRDVPPGLRRPDLEARGYEAVYMQGPNGGEWVYQLSADARDTLRERDAEARATRTTRRLRVQAGVAGTPEADGKSDDQLRELIAARRDDEARQREAMWRPRTMIRAGNAVGALAVPGINDWQRAFIAGGPTPLAVEAVGAQNAMRMLNAEALAGMDPRRAQMQQEAREAQIDALPPEQQTAVSIRRGEKMGTGRSAAHVQSRWNYWMNNFGPRPVSWREQNFRSEMEGLGYKPAEIDSWIDARRAKETEAEAAAAGGGGPSGNPWATGGV